ncbi:MAG: LysM peptidoglycan-binding domain-containing protein, partial [Victivallis vadensis]
QYRKEGNFELAEKFYLKFVERRPDSALGHRTLATLYDESLADPAAALYHYNMFLRLDPHSPDRELIDGYRRLARAKLLRALTREELPKLPDDELAMLRKENKVLRDRLDSLKRLLLNQQRAIAQLKSAAAAPQPPPVPQVPGERSYTVQPGDTPGKIARQFYGSANKYRIIMEANNLGSSTGLRVGQVLKIPASE